MRFAVFLRGANVGGHNAFQPKLVADALSTRQVKSIGTAGTFVVGKAKSEASIRTEMRPHLPVSCDVMVRPLEEVVELVRSDPFAGQPEDVQCFVSILAEPPAQLPPLPHDQPAEGEWGVRVLRVENVYALSLRRSTGGKDYPNEVVERALGVRATTRGWSALEQVAEAAESSAPS